MNRRLLFAAALLVTLLASFFIVGSLRQTPTPTPDQPQPTATTTTATPADPLVWYRSLPTPSCPTDPELLRDFYRQGQCPQGARK